MDSEPKETQAQFTTDLRKHQERHLGEEITVDGEQIGVSRWEKMLELTQEDLHERAITVTSVFRKPKISKIARGAESSFSDHAKPATAEAVLFFFFGEPVSIVHTHPMGKDLEHLRTTAISDGDIQNFNGSAYNAFIAIDRGGAHLLVHNRMRFEKQEIPSDMAKKIREDLEGKNGSVSDLIQQLATELERYGISYYFCPDVSSTGGNKTFRLAKTHFNRPSPK